MSNYSVNIYFILLLASLDVAGITSNHLQMTHSSIGSEGLRHRAVDNRYTILMLEGVKSQMRAVPPIPNHPNAVLMIVSYTPLSLYRIFSMVREQCYAIKEIFLA